MRSIPVLICLLLINCPSWAAKLMTVAQFERTLIADKDAHRPDDEIARKIGGVELSERLTEKTLSQLQGQFTADPHTQTELLLLADRSAFLVPPADELPSTSAPDAATQQHLLDAAQKFAIETLPRLPDLLATRSTFYFDDSPQQTPNGGYGQRLGFHLVGTSKVEVSVLDERKHGSTTAKSASTGSQGGLVTWGEFGSTLLIILSDSSQGKIAWSHWEQTPSGLVAVFHYQVPKAASHYEIVTPGERVLRNAGSTRWTVSGGAAAMTPGARMDHIKPAYQGFLWVDPASGTILRVSLVADLKGNATFDRSAILVDYGPVQIADQTFICPVRSLALSSAPATVNTLLEGATTEWLNESIFTNYHIFASTSRILPDTASAPAPPAPNKEQAKAGETAAAPLTQPAASNAPPIPAQPSPIAPPTPVAAETGQTAPPDATVTATAAPMPAINSPQNLSPAEQSPGPPQPTTQAVPPQSQPIAPVAHDSNPTTTFHVDVNAVLVPVVVRDRQGRSVNDLQAADFKVLDEGRLQPISGLTVQRHEQPEIGQNPGARGDPDKPAVLPPGSSTSLPSRVTIFLLDDMHLSYADLAYVRDAAAKVLDLALTGSDMAAVLTTSGTINSGLTRDRTKLTDAIKAVHPILLYRPNAAACPQISYYQADLIVNQHSPGALQDAIEQVLTVCDSKAPADLAERMADSEAEHVLNVGTQDVLATYGVIKDIVSKMADLPGQHLMILVSPGFLPVEAVERSAESQLLNLADGSNVIISALDARGLYSNSINASEDIRNRSPRFVSDIRENEMKMEENAMGELAEGTGGDFFHNSNDLGAGFRNLLLVPKTVYVLELRPVGVKSNGAYHRLKVKVDRDHVQVQARKGYFAPKVTTGK